VNRPAGAVGSVSSAGQISAEVRCLPRTKPEWEREADVVVVGSGAAGIAAALAAAGRGRRVLLLTKEELGGGSTPLAQGGLAAAIGPADDKGLHRQDTLAAGAGLCEPAAVAALVAEAPGEIARLVRRGARLERTALHLEGGHSRHRIVTAGGDAIGREVHRVLVAALLASPVEVLSGCVALDALTGDRDPGGSVGGVLAGLAGDDGTLWTGTVRARAVVLATGGFGQAYATTTNPAGVTGDGLALAARAGAELRDLEFVQFHPTVLWQESAAGQCPLLTEALRGAGAVLVDAAGQPVMAGRHPLGDLAPRDVVAAAMQQRMGLARHLWLDATGLGRAVLERDFPTVTALCRACGIDPVTEPVPVAPGAHYACGGIRADLDGRTSVPGLYAVGEAASTGVHGANRLASNSLTEALVTGRRVGERLGRVLPRPGTDLRLPPGGPGADPEYRPALAAAMSRDAGVLRSPAGLERLTRTLDQTPPAAGNGVPSAAGTGVPSAAGTGIRSAAGTGVPSAAGNGVRLAAGHGLDLATVEATNLHAVSVLVVASALARAESRGCHRWRDIPPAGPDGTGRHTVLRVEAGRPLVASPVRSMDVEEVGA
jgi:L-aspartate oxidase